MCLKIFAMCVCVCALARVAACACARVHIVHVPHPSLISALMHQITPSEVARPVRPSVRH